MKRFEYHSIIAITIIGAIGMGGLVLRSACGELPAAMLTFGVQSEDFNEPTKEAMGLMNRFVGCEFLVKGKDIGVLSSDGEPCGTAFHRNIDDGHSAGTYVCSPSSRREFRYEIHVERPGDIHTQTCIIAHELGHAVGLEDHRSKGMRGIMNQYDCPTKIILSDAEVDFLDKKFCQ